MCNIKIEIQDSCGCDLSSFSCAPVGLCIIICAEGKPYDTKAITDSFSVGDGSTAVADPASFSVSSPTPMGADWWCE